MPPPSISGRNLAGPNSPEYQLSRSRRETVAGPLTNPKTPKLMLALILTPMFAAAGWSLMYLLLGGGVVGAIVIFIVLKMFGK